MNFELRPGTICSAQTIGTMPQDDLVFVTQPVIARS